MTMLAAALPLLLVPVSAGAARPVETIRYQTGPCYGRCPVFTVTVSSNGQGTYEGQHDTAVRGLRAFAVTPAQFAAFRARLRSVRSNGEGLVTPGQPLCRDAATDQVTVDVRWTGGAGDPRHLSCYFGCDMAAHVDLRKATATAPGALPMIAAFVGAGRAATPHTSPRRNEAADAAFPVRLYKTGLVA